MGDRQQLIRGAFAALAAGDLRPFQALLAADAQWAGVPRGAEGPALCPDRAAIVGRLRHQHENGRRFVLGKLIEDGNRVAAEVTVSNPEWSEPVTMFKVFTFHPDGDEVVRLNDCIDESYARQVLAA